MNTYLEDENDVYWRIKYDCGNYIVCCLQWFDEKDYDQELMLNLKFNVESEANRFASMLNSFKNLEFYKY